MYYILYYVLVVTSFGISSNPDKVDLNDTKNEEIADEETHNGTTDL